MPKLIYRASVLTLDKQAIKNVNSVIYNFLWNGKPDKIKRLALISDYKDGRAKNATHRVLNPNTTNHVPQEICRGLQVSVEIHSFALSQESRR